MMLKRAHVIWISGDGSGPVHRYLVGPVFLRLLCFVLLCSIVTIPILEKGLLSLIQEVQELRAERTALQKELWTLRYVKRSLVRMEKKEEMLRDYFGMARYTPIQEIASGGGAPLDIPLQATTGDGPIREGLISEMDTRRTALPVKLRIMSSNLDTIKQLRIEQEENRQKTPNIVPVDATNPLSVLGDKGSIPSFGKTFVLLCVLAAVFMIGEGRGFAGVFMLDEEAVFCVYHRISGETLSRQDIEDLCHASGKPTFTRYKPSEMFVHETLGKMRSRLEQKVKKYSKDTLFKWPVSVDRRMIQAGIDWNKGTIGLPQATPYIRPRFPKSGMRKVNRILSKRIQGMADQYPSIKKYTIHLYLRPVKVEDDLETRNIARTVVHLPIRTIVFHPVKTDVTPYGHPNNVLMSFVFSDS